MGARRATITKNISKMTPGTTKFLPKLHTFRDDGAPKTFKKKWWAFLPVFLSSDKVFQQAEYMSPEMLTKMWAFLPVFLSSDKAFQQAEYR